MKNEITISERERKCLEYLAEIYPDDEANVTYFRVLAKETKLTEQQVRRSVRALARKGLAQYVRGLFDLDGMVAGSGYMATFEGALFINPCKICRKNLPSFTDDRCEECWQNRKCNKCGRAYKDHSWDEKHEEWAFEEAVL